MTSARDYESPATVIADGAVLARQAQAKFVYEPTSIPMLVDQTPSTNIYLLPHVVPLATAPGCDVTVHSWTSMRVHCATASVLTFRMLANPGWKASVSGKSAPITTFQGVYQRITVPKGTSTVSFSYAPPDATIAWLAALLGVLAIVAGLVRRRLFGTSSERPTGEPVARATL